MKLHDPRKTYKCNLCDKVYAKSDTLLNHRRTHDEPLDYHCSICNKGFMILKSFRRHKIEHERAGQ